MAKNLQDDTYIESLKKGGFSKEERLRLAGGVTFEGIPTPPRTLAMLCTDPELVVRVQAKKTILRLSEESLVDIAADASTSPDVLLFLAKHYHDSPAVGTAIIGNKNTTEKVLYYLQGEIDEAEEERESIFNRDETNQEVEFEVEDILSSEATTAGDDDVEFTIEVEKEPERRRGFQERERYSDDDIEVVIGVDDGQDEVIDEHLIERNIIDTTDTVFDRSRQRTSTDQTTGDLDQDFSSAVDAIEGKFDDVFQVNSQRQETGPEDLFVTRSSDEITPEQTGGWSGSSVGTVGSGTAGPGTIDRERWSDSANVVMNENRKEVAVTTGKFVARLPMGRYFYKVSPLEILSRIIRIAIPIVAVVVILVVFWLTLPRTQPPTEDMESGIDRTLYSIKKEGLNSKIPDPFPGGYTILSWEFVNTSPETEETSGGLKKALISFADIFSEEIAYEDAKRYLTQQEQTFKNNSERIGEIDETIAALDAEKTKYIDLQSNNKLDQKSIEEEYQKEVKTFKDDFKVLENQIKTIERDMADARRRIAEYESIFGVGGNDPGYIANKMELDQLTKDYARLKPSYDKRKAGYDTRLKAIRKQYQNMLDDTVWLQTVEKHISELQQEKTRLVSENRILEKEIKDLKGKLVALEIEKNKRPKLTGQNLNNFLVLSHYINEMDIQDIPAISPFYRYAVLKTVSNVNITLSGNGTEEQKQYKLTFMRLETEKSVLLFSWDKHSTTWVLTSIIAGK